MRFNFDFLDISLASLRESEKSVEIAFSLRYSPVPDWIRDLSYVLSSTEEDDTPKANKNSKKRKAPASAEKAVGTSGSRKSKRILEQQLTASKSGKLLFEIFLDFVTFLIDLFIDITLSDDNEEEYRPPSKLQIPEYDNEVSAGMKTTKAGKMDPRKAISADRVKKTKNTLKIEPEKKSKSVKNDKAHKASENVVQKSVGQQDESAIDYGNYNNCLFNFDQFQFVYCLI